MIYVVEMNEWGCRLYGGVGNLLTFVSFCDKNTGGAGYSLENTICPVWGLKGWERKRETYLN